MLNISREKVSDKIKSYGFEALTKVEAKKSNKVLRKIIYVGLAITFVIMFLPWTQNIRTNGKVTTLKPGQRPQSINTVIAGQIMYWYVQEGDFVRKGDTILRIAEVKSEYFDDKLLNRTKDQVEFKKNSINAYDNKIKTQTDQMALLTNQRDLKVEQLQIKLAQSKLKVQNDSLSYDAAKTYYLIAQAQFKRADSLYKDGLKSLTDWEKRRNNLQDAKAKETTAKNKWLNSKNELFSILLEISNTQVKYKNDINKLQSDLCSTQSNKLDAETNLSKLENQFSNYEYRNKLYHILAPQSGYITKTITSGIGETIKEGEKVVTLMPQDYELAVELYVEPIDLPLINIGERVRIQFDGWPAIVFSGWPNASHGTYGGIVYAIDQYISDNGKYRILVSPDTTDYAWPDALRFGAGTNNMILLGDVPIWYELWRRINGFPPNFYADKQEEKSNKK